MPRTAAAAGAVRDAIRTRITTGVYPPASRLVEHRIATDLGVSRVPVREALRDLQSEGYTCARPAGGMAVRAYSDVEIEELITLSGALEAVLAAHLARTADAAGIEALRAAVTMAAGAIDAGDTARAVDANADFHAVLLEQGAGTIAHELLSQIRPRLAWLHRQHADPATMYADHVALVDAIAAHDPDTASALVHDHAVTSRHAVDDLKERP